MNFRTDLPYGTVVLIAYEEFRVSDPSQVKQQNLPEMKKRKPVSDLDHIYGELKRSMMMGEFVPGQKLKLEELAEAFGTSHMPVREALNRLAVVHAVETAPRRSPSVPQADKKRLQDVLTLRIELECLAARFTLENDVGGLAGSLRAINDKMDEEGMIGAPNIRRYLELNHRFHFSLYDGCNNPDLLVLIEQLWMRYGPLLNLISSGGSLVFEHSQHAVIIEAVEARDPEALCQAIKTDLTNAARAIVAAIEPTVAT